MVEKGYDVPWERSIHLADSYVDPLVVTTWLRAPDNRYYSKEAVRQALVAPIEAQHEEPISDEENAAGNDCIASLVYPSDDEVQAITDPPGLDQLQSAWSESARAASDSLGSEEDYRACMSTFELPGHQPGSDDFSGMADAMTAATPNDADVPVYGREVTPAWRDFLALEDQILAADWGCRRDAYSVGMQAIPAVLDAFEEDNAAAISALAEYWTSVKAQARDLGWSTTEPFGRLTPPNFS